MNEPTAQSYIPGVCNINHAEIERRCKAGYVGSVVFIVLLIALLALSISRYVRIVLFLPALLAAIGFLQARNKFCVGYGSAGMQNASEGSASATKITDESALQKDKAKTKVLNTQASIIALAAAVVAVLLPHL